MDPKSTAKSKRSHTQHGRRAHLPPAALAHKKKAAGGDRTTSAHRGLPSNWDRYDDEISEGIGSNLGNKVVGDVGEVAPKSKGADFGYLIEQARSQPKGFGSVESQDSSAVEEFSFDFMQGVSSMLSARGKSLLSRCGDDNFIVDDDSTSSYEVPFLTMDLNALSAQLSRLRLSQRLFIEADLLPEELNLEESGDSKTTSAATTQEISEPAEFGHIFDSQTFLSPPGLVDNSNTQATHNFMDSEMNHGAGAEKDKPQAPPQQSAELEAKSSIQREQSGIRKVPEPITTHAISSSEQKQTARFVATAAEAELDMLLDSFSETSLSDSMPASLIDQISAPKRSSFGSVASKSGQSTNDSSSRGIPITSINASIDDLVAETSKYLDYQEPSGSQQKEMAFLENSLLGSKYSNAYNLPSSKAVSDSIDDSIDDLLVETSVSLKGQQQTTNQQKKGTLASFKAMDDFDSWLDTL